MRQRSVRALAALWPGGMLASSVSAHGLAATPIEVSWFNGASGFALVSMFAISAALYAIGSHRFAHAVPPNARQKVAVIAWWIGWLTLAVSLLSPLDTVGAQLLSAHMVQHELLMLVAAPLLVVGRPLPMFAWALPHGWAKRMSALMNGRTWQRCWIWLTIPLVAWSLHAVVIWAWHAPVLFESSLRSTTIHDLQHVTFMASALLFWWALVRHRTRADSILYVFTTMLHTGLLGMLLTFSVTPWYPFYAANTSAWGLTPLEDQQLAGLIMWVPSGAVLIGAGLAFANVSLLRLARKPPQMSIEES